MRRIIRILSGGLIVLLLAVPVPTLAQLLAPVCFQPGVGPTELLEACRAAIRLDPAHAEAHLNMGRALVALGSYSEALFAFRQALEFEPKWAKAHYHVGWALEKKGQHEEALAAYEAALRLKPDYALARKNRRNLLQKLGRKPREEGEAAARLEGEQKREAKQGQPVRFAFRRGPVNRHAVAVIIGNRSYSALSKDIPDVAYAHNDADAVFEYITKALGYREGNVIVLKDATQAQLISTFGTKENHKGKLYNWVRPGKSDVFLFYSGHGVPGLSDGRSYLLPVDADPATAHLNGYSLDTLYANLARLPARSITVMIDACFSGGSAGGAVVRGTSSISVVGTDPRGRLPKAAVLTAASPQQVASWDHQAQLGLFTRHVLEGLSGAADGKDFGNGDGRVTLTELKKYLVEEVTYQARRRFGREQSPQLTGDMSRVMNSLR